MGLACVGVACNALCTCVLQAAAGAVGWAAAAPAGCGRSFATTSRAREPSACQRGLRPVCIACSVLPRELTAGLLSRLLAVGGAL